jgi:hypothetical protein
MPSKNPKLQRLESLIRKEIESILRENKMKFKKKRRTIKEDDTTDPAVIAAQKAASAADIKAKELALNNAKKKLSTIK